MAGLLAACAGTGHGAPDRSAEALQARRAAQRAQLPPLPVGRVVGPKTEARRMSLLAEFDAWLRAAGSSVYVLIDTPVHLDLAHINDAVEGWGRQLYERGGAYWRYSELVNALAARRPDLRRGLAQAWDLAWAWRGREPPRHHVAAPEVVVQALLVTALCWGWPLVAALIGLMWAAMLRPGEALLARREDLVLPADLVDSCEFGLLSIREPKTRKVGARHQAALIEDFGVLRLLWLVYRDSPPSAALWPRSPATFRKRFQALLGAVGLQRESTPQQRALDLGSLRAGSATLHLQTTQDSERTRWRGRWLSTKVMQIYIQEVSSVTYFSRLPLSVRERVRTLAAASAAVLEACSSLLEARVTTARWPHRLKQMV
jgi:hypothetical protein